MSEPPRVRGHLLRELPLSELEELHAQLVAELPDNPEVDDPTVHAKLAELDLIEAELYNRS